MNIDARVLARDFPDIAGIKNNVINDKAFLRAYD